MLQTAYTFRAYATLRLSAALAIATAMPAIVASPAVAEESKGTYEMTVIRDAAYGSKLTAGKYDEAIEKIAGMTARPSERFFVSNNLCVAYTKANELDLAERACDDALTFSAIDRPFKTEYVIGIERKHKAMALSNRGVLRAILGDDTGARRDFEAARKLRAGLSAPARNLAQLETETAEMMTSLQADQQARARARAH